MFSPETLLHFHVKFGQSCQVGRRGRRTDACLQRRRHSCPHAVLNEEAVFSLYRAAVFSGFVFTHFMPMLAGTGQNICSCAGTLSGGMECVESKQNSKQQLHDKLKREGGGEHLDIPRAAVSGGDGGKWRNNLALLARSAPPEKIPHPKMPPRLLSPARIWVRGIYRVPDTSFLVFLKRYKKAPIQSCRLAFNSPN